MRNVMPCYRFRFMGLELPLYYYGHVLPPPIVKIILTYGYQMTVLEDMNQLHKRLNDTLAWLHEYKDALKAHTRAYEILSSKNTHSDRLRLASARLCHNATVNLRTAFQPRKVPRIGGLYFVRQPRTRDVQTQGFTLPEMANYQ